MKFRHQALTAGLMAAGLLLATGAAQAGTIILDTSSLATATIALGVNNNGSLNTTDLTIDPINFPSGNIAQNIGSAATTMTGLSFKFPDGSFRDATSPGCFCEGWGVSFNNTTSGFANVDTTVAGGS